MQSYAAIVEAPIAETAFRSDRVFSQEEFWRWVEARQGRDINHYELVRGRIVMTPPAGWPHSPVAARLGHLLRAHVDALGLGLVLESSAGFELPSGDTLEPDVTFVSAARFAKGPAPVWGRYLRVVPDLVVEILSESTAYRDRGEKREIYEQNGVTEYWLVDSRKRQVTVFRCAAEGASFDAGEILTAAQRLLSRAVPGFEVDVARIFA